MSREKKAAIVDNLEELFAKCSVGVLTDYRGLTTAELTDLRRKLREAGLTYHVVKNSLAQLAAKKAGLEGLSGSLVGPVAVAFGYGEITEPPRVLADYIRATKSVLSIKGGFAGGDLLSARDVETMATLPSREVLISQVMAGMQSPITGFLRVLAGPIQGMMGVLQARIDQLEGA